MFLSGVIISKCWHTGNLTTVEQQITIGQIFMNYNNYIFANFYIIISIRLVVKNQILILVHSFALSGIKSKLCVFLYYLPFNRCFLNATQSSTGLLDVFQCHEYVEMRSFQVLHNRMCAGIVFSFWYIYVNRGRVTSVSCSIFSGFIILIQTV